MLLVIPVISVFVATSLLFSALRAIGSLSSEKSHGPPSGRVPRPTPHRATVGGAYRRGLR